MATAKTAKKPATTTAGVWIDHKQAIVVLVDGTGQQTTKIKAAGEEPAVSAGAKIKNSYSRNDFTAEDRREHKVEGDRKKYYAQVISAIGPAKSILVLGPGEAKDEFAKQIKNKKGGAAVVIQTADKLTERQVAAKVGEHFAQQPANKTVPAKRAVRKSVPFKRAKTAKK